MIAKPGHNLFKNNAWEVGCPVGHLVPNVRLHINYFNTTIQQKSFKQPLTTYLNRSAGCVQR